MEARVRRMHQPCYLQLFSPSETNESDSYFASSVISYHQWCVFHLIFDFSFQTLFNKYVYIMTHYMKSFLFVEVRCVIKKKLAGKTIYISTPRGTMGVRRSKSIKSITPRILIGAPTSFFFWLIFLARATKFDDCSLSNVGSDIQFFQRTQ